MQHTTSSKCLPDEKSEVYVHIPEVESDQDVDTKNIDNVPVTPEKMPLRINFTDRPKGMMACFLLYKIVRIFYVSYYFYFMALFTLVWSLIIPTIASLCEVCSTLENGLTQCDNIPCGGGSS